MSSLKDFTLLFKNKEFEGVDNRTLEYVEQSEDSLHTIFSALIETAMKCHDTCAAYFESFKTNYMFSLVDLCEIKNNHGWCEAGLELLEFLNRGDRRPCRALCCRTDVLPIFLRKQNQSAALVSKIKDVYFIKWKWFGSEFILQGPELFRIITLVDRLLELLPRLCTNEAPSVSTLQSDEEKSPKRRALNVSLFAREQVAKEMSALWTHIRAHLGFHPVEFLTETYVASPFWKVETPIRDLSFGKEVSSIEAVRALSHTQLKRVFALITGTRPLSMELKFADNYARLLACVKKNNRRAACLFPQAEFFSFEQIPVASFQCERLEIFCDSETLTTYTLELQPVLSSVGTTTHEFDVNVTMEKHSYDIHLCSNFALRSNLVMKFGAQRTRESVQCDTKFALLSLIDHVALVEECLVEMYPHAPALEVFGELRGKSYVLNAFYFLDEKNVMLNTREAICCVIPSLLLARDECLPCLAFLTANNSIGTVLCNNLANFFYRAVSGCYLPCFGDTDDDDGIARMTYAKKVSSIAADGTFLSPLFMHFILCLYFGDADLRSVTFKSYAARALASCKLYLSEEERPSDKLLVNEILNGDFQADPDHEHTMHFARTSDDMDLFLSVVSSGRDSNFAHMYLDELPMLRLSGEMGVGIGPHKEVLAKLLLDLCNHTQFFFEIDAETREIRVRKVVPAAEQCQCCSTAGARRLFLEMGVSTQCILNVEICAKFATLILFECIKYRVSLPVNFSMSAIAALASRDEQRNRRSVFDCVRYAEHSKFARSIADRSFFERHDVIAAVDTNETSAENFGRTREVRLSAETQKRLPVFWRLLKEYGHATLYAMYKIINATQYEEFPDAVLPQPNETELRCMVLSLMSFQVADREFASLYTQLASKGFVFGTVSDLIKFRETREFGGSATFRNVEVMLGCYRKLLVAWFFVDWIKTASSDDLKGFLSAMGMNPSVLARCKSAFFASADAALNYELTLSSCETILIKGVDINVRDVTKDRVSLESIRSSFWLKNDVIKFAYLEESGKFPVISTCFRTLFFSTDTKHERVREMMNHVVALKETYTTA